MEIADTFNELGHHKTVDGVIIEWPFLVEALENAMENEGDIIQDALEESINKYFNKDTDESLRACAILGIEITKQVLKYIVKVKEIKDED